MWINRKSETNAADIGKDYWEDCNITWEITRAIKAIETTSEIHSSIIIIIIGKQLEINKHVKTSFFLHHYKTLCPLTKGKRKRKEEKLLPRKILYELMFPSWKTILYQFFDGINTRLAK